jgi:hypothetical protein
LTDDFFAITGFNPEFPLNEFSDGKYRLDTVVFSHHAAMLRPEVTVTGIRNVSIPRSIYPD